MIQARIKLQKVSFPTLFSLSDLQKKKVEVSFTTEQTSHDGGLLVLNKFEKQIELLVNLSDCISYSMHQSYVNHSIDSVMS